MTSFAADTVIAAPPARVWAALVDLPTWPRWASFHPVARGEIAAGEPVTVHFSVRGRLRIPGRARFTAVEPERRLWWRGGLGPLLRVDHGFDLEAVDGGTRLHHEERFAGPLAPVVVAILGPDQPGRYAEVNRALKAWLEADGACR